MTSEKILFVDDEPNVLQSMERQLRKRFNVTTACSGEEALRVLQEDGSFAVIVSDMRMPGMDGVELLSQVKNLYPDTVRLMLTGNADQGTAAEAVNTGQIFRFLTKPCPAPALLTSLALALRQHRLITAERELLNRTLKGSIKVLSELLSLANPIAFSSGFRVKEAVRQIAIKMELTNLWQYEVAALMSQLGCVTLPNEILHKNQCGSAMTEDEITTFSSHPVTGKKLVGQIPRLEKVAGMIEHQMTPFSEFSESLSNVSEDVQIGAQILKAVIEYDRFLHQNFGHKESLRKMRSFDGEYNPIILDYLSDVKVKSKNVKVLRLNFNDVVPGMVAEEDVIAKNGALIIPKGQEITWPIIKGLQNFLKHIGIQEPILVQVSEHNDQETLPGFD